MTDALQLLRIAFRNTARNRRRTALAGLTVALGVAAILFSRAYIDGLQGLILEFVVDARDGALEVDREGYSAAQDLAPLDLDLPTDPELEARLRAVPGVKGISPRLRFVGFVSNQDSSTMFTGVALDPQLDAVVCPRGPGVVPKGPPNGPGLIEGAGLHSREDEGIILGVDLAAALKVKLGQLVTLLVQTKGGSMDAVDLTVQGVYRYGDPMENKHSLVVPLAVGQKLLHMPGRATSYAVAALNQAVIPAMTAGVIAAVNGYRPATEVQTWGDISPYFRDVMKLQNDVLQVVVFIVFALVISGVVNTMLMSVFERTREIGTLMSIGFRRRRILKLFLLESLLLSAFASVVGAGLGLALIAYTHHRGLTFYIPAVGDILNRPVIRAGYVLSTCAGAVAAGIAGGLFPAYRASRMRPIEALRST